MIWLALFGVLGIMLVLVIIFSMLSVARQAEDDFWRLDRKLLEDGCQEDRQALLGKIQMPRPTEEMSKNSPEMLRRASA